jgi:hypothetical protein
MPKLGTILFVGALAWYLFFGWLRHRSWLRDRASGFASGTQWLSLAGTVGSFLLILGAVLCIFFLPTL